MNTPHPYENHWNPESHYALEVGFATGTFVDSTGPAQMTHDAHTGRVLRSHHNVATSCQWTGIDPALTLGSISQSSEATPSDTSTNYEPDSAIFGKRRTRLRRMMQEVSTESRLNVLPTVPESLVNQFWVVYSALHDRSYESPLGRAIFKPFYRQDGQKKRCLLCNHTIRNATQMVQHIKGIHFEIFGHKCTVGGCSFSSVRAADLKRHVQEQHKFAEVRYECSTCNRSIKHEKNFRRHMRTFH